MSSYVRVVSLDAAAPEAAAISHLTPLERLIAFLLSIRQGAIPAAINETAPALGVLQPGIKGGPGQLFSQPAETSKVLEDEAQESTATS